MTEKLDRIKELTLRLNEAARAYYQGSKELMSNMTYDKLYDELLELEEETGIVLAGSPTHKVGYEVLSELPEIRHESPMLSLDKTKEPEVLSRWLKDKEGVLSWKLDGLTIVLTYENGELTRAVTRGNGEVGELITQNAMQFENLPHKIPFKGKLVIRGEAVIGYKAFEKINEEIPDADAKYKNPRNLCSGSVRQLNPQITKERHVRLIAFQLVDIEPSENADKATDDMDMDIGADRSKDISTDINRYIGTDAGRYISTATPEAFFTEQMKWLRRQGFEVVEHVLTDSKKIFSDIEYFKEKIAYNEYPSDGLVLTYNDLEYGRSLGRTAKFPRHSIAFKWADETAETILREVEWSASRTGLINPVAIFDPVELEGTTVTRASLHNLSIVSELKLGIGDKITVYKANMIIPQIAENLMESNNLDIPDKCPVCMGKTEIRKDNDAAYLYCTNPDCSAKKIKAFELLCSRDALNIDGLSEMKLEKLISAGFIHEYADLFKLDRYHDEIVAMEGFGEKSYLNLINAIEKARETEGYRLLYGLGIPGIGLSNAKIIAKTADNSFEKMKKLNFDDLNMIDGIGEVLARAYVLYFEDSKKCEEAEHLVEFLNIKTDNVEEGETVNIEIGGEALSLPKTKLDGMVFVITGDVNIFANRREVKEIIENLGGKVTGSVSNKTTYLINNDSLSQSSKNKKAKELNISIITEKEFIEIIKN
ncbi:MAG: helix-hairpin-helix domain-containing protein [Eubacteriales bacterium]|nr:helix-hairpin-helix domain-containing protein [Eubacteriales bacterium]